MYAKERGDWGDDDDDDDDDVTGEHTREHNRETDTVSCQRRKDLRGCVPGCRRKRDCVERVEDDQSETVMMWTRC